jgi:hypothetical protein
LVCGGGFNAAQRAVEPTVGGCTRCIQLDP